MPHLRKESRLSRLLFHRDVSQTQEAVLLEEMRRKISKEGENMNKKEASELERKLQQGMKTDAYEVIRMSILQLQVCSPIPPEESDKVEKAVQKNFPSGTRGNWRLETEGKVSPVKCSEKENHWHYLFSC
jgi:DNA polymerase II large subunit